MRFSTSGFFHKSVVPGPLMHIRVKRFWTFLRKWRTQTLWWMPNQILKHFY